MSIFLGSTKAQFNTRLLYDDNVIIASDCMTESEYV